MIRKNGCKTTDELCLIIVDEVEKISAMMYISRKHYFRLRYPPVTSLYEDISDDNERRILWVKTH